MILSVSEMKAVEEKAFADGVSADALVEEAGAQIARAVHQFFPSAGVCVAVFGKGNNGADALVAARHLAAAGWDVRLIPSFETHEWNPMVAGKFPAASGCIAGDFHALENATGKPLVVLDGILGIGAKGALRKPLVGLTRAINRLRHSAGAYVFALDLPTGLDGDSGIADANCVVADTTLTMGFAKRGLLADSATAFVGRLCVLPLAELSARVGVSDTTMTLATPHELAPLLPRRGFETHKGQSGRVAIVAGSLQFLGAAVLCASGALRAGAGLVTLYVAPEITGAIAARLPAEIMLAPVATITDVLTAKHDVIAIGPGLGREHDEAVCQIVKTSPLPMVVDADAINAIAECPSVLQTANGPRILTPHPGEMERLAPGCSTRSRRDTVETFARWNRCTLLLKGARTIVGESGLPLSVNTTGTPGMAKGGNGDVLTGVIAALVGQRVRPYDAARLGAWLCGRASEIAISHGGETEETLSPSRALDFLGVAFRDLRGRCY